MAQHDPGRKTCGARSVPAAGPAYQKDPEARYGFEYAGFDVRFRVADGRLTVCEVVRL